MVFCVGEHWQDSFTAAVPVGIGPLTIGFGVLPDGLRIRDVMIIYGSQNDDTMNFALYVRATRASSLLEQLTGEPIYKSTHRVVSAQLVSLRIPIRGGTMATMFLFPDFVVSPGKGFLSGLFARSSTTDGMVTINIRGIHTLGGPCREDAPVAGEPGGVLDVLRFAAGVVTPPLLPDPGPGPVIPPP